MENLAGKPADGPIEIEAELEAEAPVERVFELLDFSAPGSAMRERGFFFLEEPQGVLGRFRAVDPVQPETVVVIDVAQFDWPRHIRFETWLDCIEPTGPQLRTISDYALSATGPDTSHVRLVETTFLAPGLTSRQARLEHALLVLNTQRHITRLCIHAALGVEAAMKVG